MILGLIEEAVEQGARRCKACEILGIDPRTLQRWRRRGIGEDRRAGPRCSPSNKLTEAERRRALEIAHAPEYRDLSPKQIVPLLADRGEYVASESTLYRVLREADEVKHRETSRPPTPRAKPRELVATGPNQVWCWDITYLPSPVRGSYYYLYLVLDVWSRKLVGWTVEDCESAEHATRLFQRVCAREGIEPGQITLHSDNGGPMKAAMLLAWLEELGVARSFSRPSVSNDNPFAESIFRTTKSRPSYPSAGFESLEAAREWVRQFVQWYNTEHLHGSIRYVTPDQRHNGEDVEVLRKRQKVYDAARKRNPNRWSRNTRNWTRIQVVRLNPDSDHAASEAA